MEYKSNRRSFLSTLGALSVAVPFGGLNLLGSVKVAKANDAPQKLDALKDKPVLTIAHCCDPQLGFGKSPDKADAYQVDLARLRKEIELVNRVKPDLVFFAGDMANNCKRLADDWPELLKTIDAPCLVAPGNHDIPDPVVSSGVQRFRAVFGDDFATTTCNGWKIVAFNSQYCRPTDEKELYEEHVARFRKELEDAKASGTPLIVGSHVPPFVKELDEKDEYFNFPTNIRREFLDYCVDSGVKFYLAGHTHTTLERSYRDVPILNGETTSQNFDGRPFGFRILRIDAARNYAWDFTPVE